MTSYVASARVGGRFRFCWPCWVSVSRRAVEGARAPRSDPAESPAPVVIDPTTRAFPDTLVGQTSAALMFTVRNTHSSALNSVGVITTGAAADQFMASGCSGMLNRNQSCVVMVVFKPTRAGDLTATLEISAGGGRKTASLTGKANRPAVLTVTQMDLSFGSISVGGTSEAKAVMIRNEGTLQAAGLDVEISGDGFERMGGTCGATLAAGTSCMQPVVFKPTSVGPKTGTLIAAVTGSPTVTVELAGNGVARPAVESLPSAVDFEAVGVGRTGRPTMVTIRNPGTAPVTEFRATASSMDFLVTSGCPAMIAASGTCTLQVAFTPKSVGAKRGVLALSVSGGDAVGVPLSGNGRAAGGPRAGARAAELRAGGGGQRQPGAGPHRAQRRAGGDRGAAAREHRRPVRPAPHLRHPPGRRRLLHLTVVFTPAAEGAATGTVRSAARCGAWTSPPAETTVAGTGVSRPSISISPAERNFGGVTVGQSSAAAASPSPTPAGRPPARSG